MATFFAFARALAAFMGVGVVLLCVAEIFLSTVMALVWGLSDVDREDYKRVRARTVPFLFGALAAPAFWTWH
jgi:hypothetical protein